MEKEIETEVSKKLHELFNSGKIFTAENKNEIPEVPGVYVAFEKGETYDGTDLKRVVRVGESQNVKTRIYKHFNGNPANTIFAQKVDLALNQANKAMSVSDYMENFSFAIIEMPDSTEEERKALEESLITTFVSDPKFVPSENWLGNFLNTGMWLSQGIFGSVLSKEDLDKLKVL